MSLVPHEGPMTAGICPLITKWPFTSYIRVVGAARVRIGLAEERNMNHIFLKLYLALRTALSRESGQSLPEYGMAVTLIALGCVAGMTAVATSVNHVFVSLATSIANNMAQ